MAEIISLDHQRIARGRPMMRADVRASRQGMAREDQRLSDLTKKLIDHLRSVSLEDIMARQGKRIIG